MRAMTFQTATTKTASSTRSRVLNIALWILQVLLAAAYLAHGWMMVSPPPELLALMNAQLGEGFRKMNLPFCPTDGNFVWVDIGRDCRPVFDALLRKGVIIRTGDIFGAPNHIRVTIGTREQNERFLGGLEEVLFAQGASA